MSPLDKLREVIAVDRMIRPVEDGIYSVLADAAPHEHLYDRRAAAYDVVVGTRLYNRVMWGNSPRDYHEFARQAITSRADGLMLDAACGSLLFTAQAYLECGRQVIAFDQSLRMLKRARARLLRFAGSMPGNILLLQADLSDLPFRPECFNTVLCMNVLHQYQEAAALIPSLKRLLTRDGCLYLTSLVSNNRFVGDRYLGVLYATGEFVRPRSSDELRKLINGSLNQDVSYRTKGNMAYATSDVLK